MKYFSRNLWGTTIFLKQHPEYIYGAYFQICWPHGMYWHVINCMVELMSSFRSSPVDCSGSTGVSSSFLHMGRSSCCLLLQCLMLCYADMADSRDRWGHISMTLVGKVTATVLRENVFVPPPGSNQRSLACSASVQTTRFDSNDHLVWTCHQGRRKHL
jgi:hypothetical protein